VAANNTNPISISTSAGAIQSINGDKKAVPIKDPQKITTSREVAKTGNGTPVNQVATNTNTSANAADPVASVNKSHQSLFGGNLEVAKALKSINFRADSYGAMTNDIAHLELWSRTPQNKEIANAINGQGATAYGSPSKNPLQGKTNAAPAATTTTPQASKPATATATKPATVQPATASEVGFSLAQSGTNLISKDEKQKSLVNRIFGRVFSANPNGLHQGLIRNTLSPADPGQLTYTTSTLKNSGKGFGTVPEIGSLNGVWQFLFNPEEISVQGNAVYATAETWGVMNDKDKKDGGKNSGQPMQWRFNQNEKLIFNKILLNGYIFGKKVKSLEEALTDLVSKATDASPGGPPVLNFMWGERTFGPCVIRDFNVREKNWDNGVLVNAEISLTLERVPEWVINDGFVDVARPARQGPITDPTAASGATAAGQQQNAPASGSAGDANQSANGKGGAPQAAPSDALYVLCEKESRFWYATFDALYKEIVAVNWSYTGPQMDKHVDELFEKYKTLFAGASTIPQFINQFNGKNEGYKPQVLKVSLGRTATAPLLPIQRLIGLTPRQKLLATAVGTARNAMENIYNRPECKKAIEQGKKKINLKSLEEKIAGKSCNDSILTLKHGETWTNPKYKKKYSCINGILRDAQFEPGP
jgi:hypothetical protein